MRVDPYDNIAILCRVVCFGQLPFGTYCQLLVTVPVESDVIRCVTHFFFVCVKQVLLEFSKRRKARYFSQVECIVPAFVSFFNTRKQTSIYCAIVCSQGRPSEPYTSEFDILPTLPFELVACTVALFTDSVSRISCIYRCNFLSFPSLKN